MLNTLKRYFAELIALQASTAVATLIPYFLLLFFTFSVFFSSFLRKINLSRKKDHADSGSGSFQASWRSFMYLWREKPNMWFTMAMETIEAEN